MVLKKAASKSIEVVATSTVAKQSKVEQKASAQIKKLEQKASKIAKKGSNVGLSFYAFFANKNDNPELLMQAAEWWIKTHQLDHFEKAIKIKQLIETEK